MMKEKVLLHLAFREPAKKKIYYAPPASSSFTDSVGRNPHKLYSVVQPAQTDMIQSSSQLNQKVQVFLLHVPNEIRRGSFRSCLEKKSSSVVAVSDGGNLIQNEIFGFSQALNSWRSSRDEAQIQKEWKSPDDPQTTICLLPLTTVDNPKERNVVEEQKRGGMREIQEVGSGEINRQRCSWGNELILLLIGPGQACQCKSKCCDESCSASGGGGEKCAPPYCWDEAFEP
jgi:hypothetical protein